MRRLMREKKPTTSHSKKKKTSANVLGCDITWRSTVRVRNRVAEGPFSHLTTQNHSK